VCAADASWLISARKSKEEKMNRPSNHLIRPVAALALVAAVVAPMARAGHDDFGVRCALALTQHRTDAAKICASDTSAARGAQPAADTSAARRSPRAAPSAPNVTTVQRGAYDRGARVLDRLEVLKALLAG